MKPVHDAEPDLNLLRVFDALMRRRSASLAARELGVSQSAVSHALARLRAATGDPLFVRSSGRMEPTARAQRLAAPAGEALRLALEVLGAEPEGFDPRRMARDFRIGAGDYATAVLLPGLLTGIATEGLAVRLSVLPLDRASASEMLDQGRVDLAIGLLPEPRRWQDRQLLYEETQACVFDGPRLGLAAPIGLDAFCALPHIVPSLQGEFPSFVDEELAACGRERRSIAALAHFLAIPVMLREVPAVATLPRRLCLACATTAALTVSALPVPARRFAVTMLWHRRDSASAAHRWLRSRVQAQAARDPAVSAGPAAP